MRFFNSAKPARVAAVEAQRIELGEFSEAGLLLVLTYFLPQLEVAKGLFDDVYKPVVAALRGELVRRWQNRGGPIAIEIADRLPALCIELSVRVFRDMAESFRTPMGSDGSATNNAQLSDALGLVGKILAALENCRVEIKDLPAVL